MTNLIGTLGGLLDVANSQLGHTESGDNHTTYWADLIRAHLAAPEFQGEPWCAGFIEWQDWKAGTPLLPVQNPYFTPSRVVYAKDHGLWDASGKYLPGDEVYFDWTGAGVAEHVGRVIADDGNIITTIEGNTSAENAVGSQANGGGVYLRHRPHGSTVLGVLAYHRLLPQGRPPRNPVKHNPFPAPHRVLTLGEHGDDVKWLQWAIGLHGAQIDGTFGKQTLAALLLFQRNHKDANGRRLLTDGQAGSITDAVLAKVTH